MSGDRRGYEETGKRGSGRLVMKIGNAFSKEMNSGLGRSGVVHLRIYSPSESSKGGFTRDVASNSSSSPAGPIIGLGGSSIPPAGARVDPVA